jgi:hypothetical protein
MSPSPASSYLRLDLRIVPDIELGVVEEISEEMTQSDNHAFNDLY